MVPDAKVLPWMPFGWRKYRSFPSLAICLQSPPGTGVSLGLWGRPNKSKFDVVLSPTQRESTTARGLAGYQLLLP